MHTLRRLSCRPNRSRSLSAREAARRLAAPWLRHLPATRGRRRCALLDRDGWIGFMGGQSGVGGDRLGEELCAALAGSTTAEVVLSSSLRLPANSARWRCVPQCN